MLNKINPSLALLASLAIRVLIKGASIGDAVAMAALAALYGYHLYLESKKEVPINDVVKQQVEEIRSAVNSLKIARSIGR